MKKKKELLKSYLIACCYVEVNVSYCYMKYPFIYIHKVGINCFIIHTFC